MGRMYERATSSQAGTSWPEEYQLLTFANNSMRMSACVRATASNKSITEPPSPWLRLLVRRTKKPMDRGSHIDRLGPAGAEPRWRGHACTEHIKSNATRINQWLKGILRTDNQHQSFTPPNGLFSQLLSVPPAGSPVGSPAGSPAGSSADSSGTPGLCADWSAQLLCARLASYAACAAGCFLPRRPSNVAPSRLSSKAPFCLLRSLTCCLAAAVTAAECCP